MKKLLLFLLAIIYITYAVAIFTVNDFIGDILSPVLELVTFGFVFYGFVIREKDRVTKLSGIFFAVSIFSWFVCDLMWGISTLILHIDPEKDLIIMFGYSATNLCLFISLIIAGYFEIRSLNKIQILLDTLIISICVAVFLFVFVFQQNFDNIGVIKSNFVYMMVIIMDTLIFTWTNVWLFSTRFKKTPLFDILCAIGIVMFVITDLIYYYVYFYTSYQPNSLIDGAYMLSFTVMGISGYVKVKEKFVPQSIKADKKAFLKFKKEAVIIIVPLLIFIFRRSQLGYGLFLVIAILIYYVLLSYTHENIMREELFKMEKNHVSELEERVEERTKELVRIMNTDIVTGLYNRRYFEEYLSRSCDALGEDECINLLYIDINKLKSIKALYGNCTSEILLKEIASRLKEIASELMDSVLLSSYAEDIFVITLIGRHYCEKVLTISEKIINKCSGTYYIDNRDIVVSLNIGISRFPADSKNHEDLIKNADSAMIIARKLGYNRVLQYDESIGINVNNRNKIEMKLKMVDFDDEFRLYFQPQVSCENGDIIGVEALIRWYTKSGKFIPPNEFIPITEETGQIVPLGYWIMEQAASQLAEWRNFCSNEIRMAINVSVKQLTEIEFIPRLKGILNKYGISTELFEIEITENIEIDKNIQILENLKALRELGISIAIDDFGTGYSSLYYLKNLPMDRIKIAKELVDNIENDGYSNSIIKMVIEIAKNNGTKVIAEGVETKEQWDCLKVLGCDEIQGYYFAKPMPGNELLDNWIKNKNDLGFM